jgi:hypothetical protein
MSATTSAARTISLSRGAEGRLSCRQRQPDKIALLRSPALCNGCHDVRVPLGADGPGDLQHFESNVNPGASGVTYFRLENLSTEWQTGAYSGSGNPFNKQVRCRDCHMSTFPFSANSTYQVGDMTVTSTTLQFQASPPMAATRS